MNHRRHRQCHGKVRHRTPAHAKLALAGTMAETGDLGLVYYFCGHCKGYHVGHARRGEQRRLRAQRLVERIDWAMAH